MVSKRTSLPKKILLLGALGVGLWSCGGSGGDETTGGDSGGSGDVTSSGGATSSGGTTGTGGSAASGGTTGTGGSAASGGTTGTGGSAASGGTASTGETSGSGGSTASGDTTGSAGGDSAGGGGMGGSATGGAGTGGSDTGGGGGSVTCPTPALRAGDTNETVQVGSQSRSYVLHVPAAYDGSKPVPLVVDFHPLGGSGPSERSGSPYPAQTDPEGVIMAFPSGMRGPSGGAWNVGPCCVANTDDVAFAKAMVAKIQQTACIDPKRIYAVGFSMGGGMSHYLACHAADVFAAVAPAAFDLLKENIDDCKPSRPITVVSFRGTSDPIVPYAGGYSAVVSGMPITFLGAKTTFEKWAEINQCTGSPSAEDGQGCSTYSNCQDGVEVALCTKQGGGHEAGNAAVGWPVLKRHTMP
jgi:polyhydroxybutyrate depolymerase